MALQELSEDFEGGRALQRKNRIWRAPPSDCLSSLGRSTNVSAKSHQTVDLTVSRSENFLNC